MQYFLGYTYKYRNFFFLFFFFFQPLKAWSQQILDTHPSNTLAITSEKSWMSLTMLWYRFLKGKIISNQRRLKAYIFTVKIIYNKWKWNDDIFKKSKFLQNFCSVAITKSNFSYVIKINKFLIVSQDILKWKTSNFS